MNSNTMPEQVKAAFGVFPTPGRYLLLRLRLLILEVWSETGIDCALTETLKWGQPSYLPSLQKIGTTLRLGFGKSGEPALLVHCQTSLISELNEMFPGQFRTEGTRAILFGSEDDLHPDKLRVLIARGLTYHRKKAG